MNLPVAGSPHTRSARARWPRPTHPLADRGPAPAEPVKPRVEAAWAEELRELLTEPRTAAEEKLGMAWYDKGMKLRSVTDSFLPARFSMRTLFATLFVIVAAVIASFNFQDPHAMAADPQSSAAPTASKSAPLAHIVFFSLADSNDANRQKLVEACKKYLDNHKGVIYFGVGVNAPQYDREVNDRDYDVALHLVFESAKDHDAYQANPRHKEFIAKNKDLWKTVRVFDSTLK